LSHQKSKIAEAPQKPLPVRVRLTRDQAVDTVSTLLRLLLTSPATDSGKDFAFFTTDTDRLQVVTEEQQEREKDAWLASLPPPAKRGKKGEGK
jgi:hypothetical protein